MTGKQKKKKGCLPIVIVVAILAILISMCSNGESDNNSSESTTLSSGSITKSISASEPDDTTPFGFDVTFYDSFKNDTTGRWRKALVATNDPIQDYALKYYENYFKSDDEVHVIYNFALNSVNNLTVSGSTLFVRITDYQDSEEHDAKKACSGTLLGEYQIDTETGEVAEITPNNNSVSDRINQIIAQAENDVASATKKEYSTAASYINKHIDNFQNNDKAMENMIYYGMLLYYGYSSGNKTSDMGYNAAEAARLLYSEEAGIDSTTVQEYIGNVKTDLNDMYNPTTEATTKAVAQEFPTEHNEVEANPDTTYIININSMKFHLIDGPDTDSISPEHRQETTLSKEELINQGYDPCGRCFK